MVDFPRAENNAIKLWIPQESDFSLNYAWLWTNFPPELRQVQQQQHQPHQPKPAWGSNWIRQQNKRKAFQNNYQMPKSCKETRWNLDDQCLSLNSTIFACVHLHLFVPYLMFMTFAPFTFHSKIFFNQIEQIGFSKVEVAQQSINLNRSNQLRRKTKWCQETMSTKTSTIVQHSIILHSEDVLTPATIQKVTKTHTAVR